MLRKDSFFWNNDAQIALDALKVAMTEAPVLKLPDFKKQFVLQINKLGTGMGTFLNQNGHPIAFFYQKLMSIITKLPTYAKELHAITMAIQKWRHYYWIINSLLKQAKRVCVS